MITVRSDDTKINWLAKGYQRIAQNVHNLIRLWAGDVPYDRDMGLEPTILTKPASQAVPLLTANVALVIEKYAADANVSDIRVSPTERQGDYLIEVDLV